jgi:uncharacterized MAPEG superfamily protein
MGSLSLQNICAIDFLLSDIKNLWILHMTDLLTQRDLTYWCLLIVGTLPYLYTMIAKWGIFGESENHDARAFHSTLEGYRRRAISIQLNSFEGFPLFAVGVLVAHQRSETPDLFWLNALALSYVIFRLLYGWAYLTDRAGLRTLVWTLGFISTVALYFV